MSCTPWLLSSKWSLSPLALSSSVVTGPTSSSLSTGHWDVYSMSSFFNVLEQFVSWGELSFAHPADCIRILLGRNHGCCFLSGFQFSLRLCTLRLWKPLTVSGCVHVLWEKIMRRYVKRTDNRLVHLHSTYPGSVPLWLWERAWAWGYTHAHMHTCMHNTCTHARTHACTHAHTHTHAHTCTHAQTHTQTTQCLPWTYSSESLSATVIRLGSTATLSNWTEFCCLLPPLQTK